MSDPEPTTWARRAAAAEGAVTRRHLRRLWGIPATRLGVVAAPASVAERVFRPWHFWWQAHLLDCLVDAELREPRARRRRLIRDVVRGHRLRNGLRWTNDYYDDMAWWGLALDRARRVAPGAAGGVAVLSRALTDAWSDAAGGGIPWRRGDDFRNTPANGPAAILLARTGRLERAAATVDWIDDRLRLAESDLVADGLRPGAEPGSAVLVETVYTYCQGVVIGAEVELARHGRDRERVHRLVLAVDRHLAPGGVLHGHGGGDGGLFTGILARYLALVSLELPIEDPRDRQTAELAASLVRGSAEAAWRHRAEVDGQPVFGPDWATAARAPTGLTGPVRDGSGAVAPSPEPERDLSVQLGAWMLLEAVAAVDRDAR